MFKMFTCNSARMHSQSLSTLLTQSHTYYTDGMHRPMITFKFNKFNKFNAVCMQQLLQVQLANPLPFSDHNGYCFK